MTAIGVIVALIVPSRLTAAYAVHAMVMPHSMHTVAMRKLATAGAMNMAMGMMVPSSISATHSAAAMPQ